MLTGVNFTITNGGLGRTSGSKDGISAYLYLSDTYPGVMTAANPVKKFNSGIQEVEDYGITSITFPELHYHLKHFFLMGGSEILVIVYPTTTTVPAAIQNAITLTNGEARLMAHVSSSTLTAANVIAIQTAVATYGWSEKKPFHFIYGGDTSTITKDALIDLRNLASECPYVSVVLGQDTDNYPATLTRSLPFVGGVLGALSSSDVATSPLDHTKFNYASSEMLRPGFMLNDGTDDSVLIPVSDPAVTALYLDDIDEKGYIFFRYQPNVPGTYLNNDHTCSKITSDIYCIPNSRTIAKAIREVDTAVTPLIGGKLYVTSNGALQSRTIDLYTNTAYFPLSNMKAKDELNDFAIYIDPTQDVSAGAITIQISLQPVPTARWINVAIGFQKTL